jgi:hypothetical protein
MNSKYGAIIILLLAISALTGWYSLSLSHEVESLKSENAQLSRTIERLQREVENLRNKTATLSTQLDEVSITVDLLVDFGNGTKVWHNDTRVPIGYTLLNLTYSKLRPVEYTVYPFGVFVNKIMGVPNQGTWYWLWWEYGQKGWKMGETGADVVKLKDGGIYAWIYTDTSKLPSSP